MYSGRMYNANTGKLSNFYSGKNDIQRQEKESAKNFSQAIEVPSQPSESTKSNSGGLLSGLNLNNIMKGGNPLSSLFGSFSGGFSGGLSRGLSGVFGDGISSILANLQGDDLILLLVIFLLLNENKEDDYLLIIILGVLLFT